jgi:uncharacterized protein (TIGR00299 family) protein
MKVLYFDCPAGLSGDMALGALLDLGLDVGAFKAELGKLGIDDEFELDISKSEKCGIAGMAVRVHPVGGREPHEHGHAHHHRKSADIVELIGDSALERGIKEKAVSMFRLLAEAEGKVHGIPPEEVHFHEVGAVDSIVDIVGTCICMHLLHAEKIIFSPLNTGSGRVKCAHGMLPVPAPATVELLAGVPCYSDGTMSELTTPTGVLIARAFADGFGPLPRMAVEKAGYGLGCKDFDFPNAARAILGRADAGEAQTVCVVECNVDDMTGEAAGYALEKLFEAGALDAFFTPIYMKKNRPAYMITAICDREKRAGVERALLAETTTLGVRVRESLRTTLPRRIETVETPWGRIRIKIAEGHEVSKFAPEYEDCRRAAAASGRPFNDVYAEALRLARQKFS